MIFPIGYFLVMRIISSISILHMRKLSLIGRHIRLTVAAIAATSSSTPLTPVETTEATSTDSNAETFDSYSVHNLPAQLPDSIQLPNLEPAVPFYPPEPATYLRAPQF
ncbi:hypothetical protein GWI33_002780, partial [Rhynchophorus ferrugineus]